MLVIDEATLEIERRTPGSRSTDLRCVGSAPVGLVESARIRTAEEMMTTSDLASLAARAAAEWLTADYGPRLVADVEAELSVSGLLICT
jgi:hypothetical protein